MLTNESRERLKGILERLSSDQAVTLEERKYLYHCADKDQSVATWVHKARREQQHREPTDSLEKLLDELTLGSLDPDSQHNGKQEDLAEFFLGAPSWLGRS